MCGICGVVSFNFDGVVDKDVLVRMNRLMFHRGPDEEGYYIDAWAGLAMRRLSIIDLSSGQQPITNEDGTIWIVFNGEIYNYRELRAQLEARGHIFKTHSDTEVILHAYEEFGDKCPELFNGMFGFAIWDTVRKRLFIARDHVGIKPMYYWADGGRFVFGSELKTVVAHPEVPREVDLIAVDQFLTLEYIPAPRTIFKHIHKLPPGHRMVFENGKVTVEQYWDIPFRQIPNNEDECAEMLSDLLGDAVRMQMVSDVPLGAFLSGGIDSSTVVAYMAEASSTPVRTFSIGFADQTYNELPYARMVAGKFRTQHREEILQPNIADVAERLMGYLDEPFGDFSIFPTYLVSKMARRHVKVVLSGDGGDELFAGYDTYVAQGMDRYYSMLPERLRREIIPALLDRIPPQPAKKGLVNKTKRFVEGAALASSLQHTRWMTFMNQSDKERLYRAEMRAGLNGASAADVIEGYFRRAAQADALAQQQYVDVKTYMVDDILTKVDRMSMAASIEARVPLLDYRIVEFALNLPPEMKLRRGQTKAILRKAIASRVPEAVLKKPKEGFSIPLKHWLCGPLRPLMNDLLSPETLRKRGYFQPETVTGWIAEHVNGKVNHSHRLWALMSLEIWHRNVLENKGTGLPAEVNVDV